MSCGRFVENFARIPEVGGSCVEILALNLSIQWLFGHCLLTLQHVLNYWWSFQLPGSYYLAYIFLCLQFLDHAWVPHPLHWTNGWRTVYSAAIAESAR